MTLAARHAGRRCPSPSRRRRKARTRAILSIDHPSIPGHAHRVLAAIVVPYRFNADNGYSVKAEVTPPLPGDLGVFVDVPPGTAALTFSASSPNVRLSTSSVPTRTPSTRARSSPVRPRSRARSRAPSRASGRSTSTARSSRNYDPETPIPLKATPVTITATTLGHRRDGGAGGARGAQGDGSQAALTRAREPARQGRGRGGLGRAGQRHP